MLPSNKSEVKEFSALSQFIRARSEEQKAERMAEVKAVTAKLFKTHTYHDVTLSSIGEQLGWSRANLYKYVTSKEEIFLELAADARDNYFSDLLRTFPIDKELNLPTAAKKWAIVSNRNKDWGLYGNILMSIIEVNVSIEKLKTFKKDYYDTLEILKPHFEAILGIPQKDFADFLVTIHYHECGLQGACEKDPLIKEALKELGIKNPNPKYKKKMEEFILMCLNQYSTF